MEIYDEYVTPTELSGYARARADDLAENQFTLSRWLPNQTIPDLTYRFNRGPVGLLDVADYRAYGGEPTFGRREGITRVEGSLPPLGHQMLLGEYDQLLVRNAEPEVRDLLLRDSAAVAERIGRRVEVARGNALVNGSVTIAENGQYATVDFNRSPNHTVVAAVAWSDASNGVPLDNMEAWTETYLDTNGVRPAVALMSTKTARLARRSNQVQRAIYGEDFADRRVSLGDLNELLADDEMPQVVTYDATAAGRRIIPEGKVILLPAPGDPNSDIAGSLGASLWGTTLESQIADYGIETGEEPGIVVAAFIQKETPVHVNTVGSAIALPIMANPDLSFVATVSS
ncbi:hypothetical protein GCM10023201_41000 [Actinomycetospora corticicola]|uniref:Major capsid protein E n=1 Tax=Actinomycetospora corticicola TaxID=663602 RepID=A0A7Y9DWJ6_9PSEU|nr:major capsid protein [Actinomycetospora corticicola]NYD36815.1 hypothetical protein [Actinomycetospora corticicola]